MSIDANAANERVNILLVDDQPGKLLSYKAILSQLGENLITATSGREALEHLLRTDITVVVTDVSMPDLDGFELAQIMRQHPRYEKTAIIFVSGVHLTDLDRLRGYESGAVDYVSVPIVPELLRAKVSVFTELYRKTRELERLNLELEQRVAIRTAELEASTAMQVELAEQLREASRRKDEFLALLSHELRNPLAPIRNAVQILRHKSPADEDVIWCRDVIERQTNQLTRLVDDLLDISRITEGKIKLRSEILDLAAIVRDAVEASQPLIDAQRHRLEVSQPARTVRVEGDPARLTQVVANLLNNAAKFQHPDGYIGLEIERDGDHAVIRVRDRGIGIDPNMMGQVFERFSQAELELDRTHGGLGLGLSLVKSLVELHGGRVEATSAGLGQGSEFTLRLPGLAERPSEIRPAAAATREPSASSSACRILVVDDNEDAASALAKLLRFRRYQVEVANDGPQALEVAASLDPEVIFLDIGLPAMNGFEVCRRLRLQGQSDAYIVALTGFGEARDRQRSREAGFDAHIIKPVDFDELLKLLAERPRAIASI